MSANKPHPPVTIYHNPRCSKSRGALQILRDRQVAPEIIDYQKNPPSPDELAEICRKLGKKPVEIIRFQEKIARELGLSPTDARSDAEWFALMSAHPILIERPIVVAGDRAVIGRPPENVRQIF